MEEKAVVQKGVEGEKKARAWERGLSMEGICYKLNFIEEENTWLSNYLVGILSELKMFV